MKLQLTINGTAQPVECSPAETLFAVLRRLGFYGVKFGDEQGLSGSDTVILDGKPLNSSLMLAAQAEGHFIVTIEGLGEHPDQGWRKTDGLHPIQQAFVESGAIQCGYCTPAQVLAAKVDGILVIVQPGRTHRDTITRTLKQLKLTNARVLGLVFNRISRNLGYYSGYYNKNYSYMDSTEHIEETVIKEKAGRPWKFFKSNRKKTSD